jgi:hypothetical protein
VDGALSGDEDGEQLAPGPTPMLPCTACTALRDENVRLRLAFNASKIVDADAEGDATLCGFHFDGCAAGEGREAAWSGEPQVWCVKDHSMKHLGTFSQARHTIISTVSASCVVLFLCVSPRLPHATNLIHALASNFWLLFNDLI